MIKNGLKIRELQNTYLDKDPKFFDLIKYIVGNLDGNTTDLQNLTKSLATLTTNIDNGSIMNSDSVLSLISLRV
jgi:hypothetical protein